MKRIKRTKQAISSSTPWLVAFVAISATLQAAENRDNPPVDFAREILPLLSDKCFVCHGPDGEAKDELRLDSFAGATQDLGGHRAIDPGAPNKSEILVRLHSADEPMPPADAEKQLTAKERKLLSRWVRQGGEYAKHWAFVPPRKVQPNHEGNATTINIVDTFVQARMQEKGVTFAPVADLGTLARRVALVLTGLPASKESA